MRPSLIEIEPALLCTVIGGDGTATGGDGTMEPPPRPTFSPEAPIRRRVQGRWKVNTILGTMSGEGEAVVNRTRIGACLEHDTIDNCLKLVEQKQ
jgi:hypothetical protein